YFLVQDPVGTKCYLGLLSSQQINQIYMRNRDKLFNLNIRNYIGETRTNKEIIKTAIDEAERFFFYNNGISAVARRVTPVTEGTQTRRECSGFSVINGAQTFRSIAKAHHRSSRKPLRVLIRVTELDYSKSGAGDVLDK